MKSTIEKSNHSGISLITLIITIVVMIILTSIVLYMQFGTVDNAAYAKFVHEFEEVRKSVETVRLSNTKISIDNIDNGFAKVYVTGEIPYGFTSIGDEENQAYLVNLNFIGCDALTTGRDYPRFESLPEEDRIVTFGKDDVYVYDSRGRLYYAKGVSNNGSTVYEIVDRSNNAGIKITNKNQTLNPEKTKAVITVTVESKKEIESVTIGGKPATQSNEGNENNGYQGTYTMEATENGNYDIVVKDVEGNITRDTINVTGVGSNGSPEVTGIVKNGTLEDNVWVIDNEMVAKLQLDSETATNLYISTTRENSSDVTDWLAFSQNVEKYFQESGDKSLYVYVKDENGNTNESPYEIKIRIILDGRPVSPTTNVEEGEINIYRDETVPEEVWARHGDFAKYKDIIIEFPENMQSNGYVSSYRIKTNLSVKWNNVYQNKVTVRVTKNNTTIEAKVAKVANSVIASENEIDKKELVVTKIDTNPPTITKLEKQGMTIVGEAVEEETESESGMPEAKYLIMMNSVDFNIVSVGNYTWSNSPVAQITEGGRYYFYARDNVGNVAVKSIVVDGPDTSAPVIDSVTSTAVEDDVIIRTVAHDDVGIVGYTVVAGTSEDIPLTWTEIEETQQAIFNQTESEDGPYTVWVKDNAGNTDKEVINVVTNKYPILNTNYPSDLHISVGNSAQFKVVVATDGYPNVYDYAWYVSKDNGATWQVIPNETTPIYMITNTPIINDGYLYRCKVTNARGSVESRAAKVEVVDIGSKAPTGEVTVDGEMVLGGLIINNGAATTTSNTLSLKVVAINAYEVNISETETKSATWVKYKDTISYTLQDDSTGNKTIYVRIRDNKGNELNKEVHETIRKTE